MIYKINSDDLDSDDFKDKKVYIVDASNEENFIQDYNQFVEKFSSQLSKSINWLTNISIGLLGFFVALLLQLKFNDFSISSFLTISSLSFLSISVLMGLYFKIKYDFQKVINQFIDFLNDAKVLKHYTSKGVEHETEELLELNLERKKRLFSSAIYLQISCFLISLLFISIFLLRILFYIQM